MKRARVTTVLAALLVLLVPGSAAADKPFRFTDHRISVFCVSQDETTIAGMEVSEQFGEGAFADAFLDPLFFSGVGDSVDVTSNGELTLSAALVFVDELGEPAGDGSLVATVNPVGESETQRDEDFGNINVKTTRIVQPLEGTATLTLPDRTEIDLLCSGAIVDESVFESRPHAFVLSFSGVLISCIWPIGDEGFAFFFAEANSVGGNFSDAGLFTSEFELFGLGTSSAEIDPTGVSATVALEDPFSGDPQSAVANANFSPLGDPVTSFLRAEHTKIKVVEQRFEVDGSVEFSTGHTFDMTTETCFANAFDRHSVNTNPSGPKRKAAPANDTPDGAIALEPGDRVQVNTSGAALEPEVPATTCPEGFFDSFGRTVWYTVEGTGEEITVDTAGTRFDTVMAVYVMEGEELVEIACVDDVFFEPIGQTFQAAITGPTEEGVTYWIQVGGFRDFFDPENVDSGRLKLRVT